MVKKLFTPPHAEIVIVEFERGLLTLSDGNVENVGGENVEVDPNEGW